MTEHTHLAWQGAPPPGVVEALANAKAACLAWPKTEYKPPNHHTLSLQTSNYSTSCSAIVDPVGLNNATLDLVLWLSVFAVVASLILWEGVARPIGGGLIRLGHRGLRRWRRYREPEEGPIPPW